MSNPVLLGNDGRNVRDSDSNSLLRMYDLATEVLTNSQLKRARVDKLIQRITKELQKRNVKF